MIIALLNQNGGVDKTTTVTLDSVAGWSRQRFQVVVIDADRKGENENCWLDWSKQRAKEGLSRLFPVIGLAPGAPRCEALEIACTVDHVVTGKPPRFAVRTRSALFAIDVALKPFQPSSSGEGEPVEIRKLLKEARIFRPGLHPRFVSKRYGPRALTVLERVEARAKQDLPTPRSRVGRRVTFANVVCSGQFVWKPQRDGYAAWADDHTRCRSCERRAVMACNRKSAFAARPSDPEARS